MPVNIINAGVRTARPPVGASIPMQAFSGNMGGAAIGQGIASAGESFGNALAQIGMRKYEESQFTRLLKQQQMQSLVAMSTALAQVKSQMYAADQNRASTEKLALLQFLGAIGGQQIQAAANLATSAIPSMSNYVSQAQAQRVKKWGETANQGLAALNQMKAKLSEATGDSKATLVEALGQGKLWPLFDNIWAQYQDGVPDAIKPDVKHAFFSHILSNVAGGKMNLPGSLGEKYESPEGIVSKPLHALGVGSEHIGDILFGGEKAKTQEDVDRKMGGFLEEAKKRGITGYTPGGGTLRVLLDSVKEAMPFSPKEAAEPWMSVWREFLGTGVFGSLQPMIGQKGVLENLPNVDAMVPGTARTVTRGRPDFQGIMDITTRAINGELDPNAAMGEVLKYYQNMDRVTQEQPTERVRRAVPTVPQTTPAAASPGSETWTTPLEPGGGTTWRVGSTPDAIINALPPATQPEEFGTFDTSEEELLRALGGQ